MDDCYIYSLEELKLLRPTGGAYDRRMVLQLSFNGQWLSTLFRRYAERRNAERTRRQLSELSDHMLHDIGLRREQVDALSPQSRSPSRRDSFS
jgi:uncharacterized protein YjiS (DUF1127 family)